MPSVLRRLRSGHNRVKLRINFVLRTELDESLNPSGFLYGEIVQLGNYETVKNFRQRLKARATYVLGDKCQVCGYDRCQAALEFHHLNPEEKELNFGGNTNRSWIATREELKKCILLCANCHREVHNGVIDNSTLISSFNEERAKEIDSEIYPIKYYCIDCGVQVKRGVKRCPTCATLANRKVKVRPSREELKGMIRKIPFEQIGKKYDVAGNTIKKWCDDYNLPRLKSIINSLSDEEWNKI